MHQAVLYDQVRQDRAGRPLDRLPGTLHRTVVAAMRYAHLYRKQGGGFELYVSDTPSIAGIFTPFCDCTDKTQARAICTRQGFKPWNF